MAVTLLVPSVLRRYAGGAATVPVTGSNGAEAFADLFSLHPDLRERVLDDSGAVFHHLLVFKNEVEVARARMLETALADGDVLELVAAAVGG